MSNFFVSNSDRVNRPFQYFEAIKQMVYKDLPDGRDATDQRVKDPVNACLEYQIHNNILSVLPYCIFSCFPSSKKKTLHKGGCTSSHSWIREIVQQFKILTLCVIYYIEYTLGTT